MIARAERFVFVSVASVLVASAVARILVRDSARSLASAMSGKP